MQNEWIQELGGLRKAAALIAPVMRVTQQHANIVHYTQIPELKESDFENACKHSTVNGVWISADDLEDVYSQLQEIHADVQMIAIEALGCFCLGDSKNEADKITKAMKNGTTFAYVEKKAQSEKRLNGKIAIVTGSAQGFGDGIARELLSMGAHVIIADLNEEQAAKNAEEMNGIYGDGYANPIKVDVSDESSVEAMIEDTVLEYGGLDLFVSNAGIVRAGSIDEMTLSDFDLVTKINYTAFFICTKYASPVFKLQYRFDSSHYADIIQINSKSGLDGSNKNFAYAGSKFGGIGLVQSFAKELVEFNIKVNAICPGNYYDGPLWSDPEKGLFVQYLNAGKIPGAKTVEDVREAYVSKVPMRKGCSPKDVARAICYCVEQENETGQALPVTGGQIMMN